MDQQIADDASQQTEQPKRPRRVVGSRARRGRPRGSKNKPGHKAGRPQKVREEFAPSIWECGRAEIAVEQGHIDEALRANSSHCAIAMAIAAAVPHARRIAVDLQTIRWTDPKRGVRYVFLTPHVAQTEVIIPFDQGEECHPVTFKMRPAFVTRAGRKFARHTPEPEQLKGTGLKVADPWNDEKACTESLAADHGAPAAPLPKLGRPKGVLDKKPRQRGTMISETRPDGSIPVTLGGKLPPVSVLARREYGLRALKR
jgi:hypothetical protein